MWTNSTVWRRSSSREWSLCQLPLWMHNINYKGWVAPIIISWIVHFTHVSVTHDTSDDVVVVVNVCHKSNYAVSNGTVLIMRYY